MAPVMVHILLQWDILKSLVINVPCYYLLSLAETETFSLMMNMTREEFSSTRQRLPMHQRLFIISFVKTLVGMAYVSEECIQNLNLELSSQGPLNVIIPASDFAPDALLTEMWNRSITSRNRRLSLDSLELPIGTILRLRYQARLELPSDHNTQPVIVVKLVPDWSKIVSFTLSSTCLSAALYLGGNRTKEAVSFVVAFLFALGCLVRCISNRLKAKSEPKAGEKQCFESSGRTWEPSYFPDHSHIVDEPTPYLSRHNSWIDSPTTFTQNRTHRVLSKMHSFGSQYGNASEKSFPRPSQKASIRRLSYSDYTLGWICALPIEMATAIAMLDELHEELPRRPHDSNTYILGRMCSHNIVITCLPSGILGPVSAATVAIQMLSTFQSIRFGLMVGIGGGVPSQADIRLADVVVGTPTKHSGGVLQCGPNFEPTRTLNNPPYVLLNALSKLRANHHINGNRIPELLSEMFKKHPAIEDSIMPKEQDRLFHAEYKHPGPRGSCSNCDEQYLVPHALRSSTSPQIHYGLIVSANAVMRNAATRDQLARELGNLCFEMEAAGLDNFPCLVIRGISDYADSHKNDHWQGYAAATAAAYAKELLSVIPSEEVESERMAYPRL